MSAPAPAPQPCGAALRETLRFAVPIRMIEYRGAAPHDLQRIAADNGHVAGAHADEIQFGGKHCAESVNALAKALAAAALAAGGGIDFLGLHWCAIPYCRAANRFEHAPTPEEPRP